MTTLTCRRPVITRTFKLAEQSKPKVPNAEDGTHGCGRRRALASREPLSEDIEQKRRNLKVEVEEMQEDIQDALFNLEKKSERRINTEKEIDAVLRLSRVVSRIENSLSNMEYGGLLYTKNRISLYGDMLRLMRGDGFGRKHALESLEAILWDGRKLKEK